MEPSPTLIADRIRSLGYRMTPQRLSIIHLLCDSEHIAPTEIHQQLISLYPGFTEPTVYRTLNFLNKLGIVRATHVGNGKLHYELARDNHHHIQCHRCGRRTLLTSETLQPLFERLEVQTGYLLTQHHLTLSGLCPNCKG